jgi:hypothetical protein
MKRRVPRETWTLLAATLILAFLFCLPYESRDFLAIEMDTFFHIGRLVSLSRSIRSGSLLPRLFLDQNNGFGYGSPLFYCDLLLVPFALLHVLGFSTAACYKLMIFFFTWLSAWTMTSLLRLLTHSRWASLTAAAVWLFASYRITDVYVRGALGEVMAMAFLPLLLESFCRIVLRKESSCTRLVLALCGLVFSHNLTFAMGVCLLMLLWLLWKREWEPKIWRTLIKGTLLAFLLSAWFTLPMLEQLGQDEYYLDYYASNMDLSASAMGLRSYFQYTIHFGIGGYGMASGEVMTLSPGWVLMFLPLLYFQHREKDRKTDRMVLICLILGLVFLILPASFVPWDKMRFLGILQFPWRLETLACLLLSVPCAAVLKQLPQKKNLRGLVLCLVLADGSFRLLPAYQRTFGITSRTADTFATDGSLIDPYYSASYMRTELAGGDYLPWSSPDFRTYTHQIHDVQGNALSLPFECSENGYSFTVTESGTYILPLTWYKGWVVEDTATGEWEIVFESANGLTACQVSAGTYRCYYAGTLLQKTCAWISLGTALFLLVMGIRKKSQERAGQDQPE